MLIFLANQRSTLWNVLWKDEVFSLDCGKSIRRRLKLWFVGDDSLVVGGFVHGSSERPLGAGSNVRLLPPSATIG
jgi:hypothetical protein